MWDDMEKKENGFHAITYSVTTNKASHAYILNTIYDNSTKELKNDDIKTNNASKVILAEVANKATQ